MAFTVIGPDLTCVRCKSPMVLAGNRCVESCFSAGNVGNTIYRQKMKIINHEGGEQRESMEVEEVNVCRTSILNCRIASESVEGEHVASRCNQCFPGFMNMIRPDERQWVPYKPSDGIRDIIPSSPLVKFPPVSCEPLAPGQTLLGEQAPGKPEVKNCMYYDWMEKDVVGCVRCAHGFVGTVVDTTYQCLDYDNTGCISCRPGFRLINPKKCVRVTTIPHCVGYVTSATDSECQQCEVDWFVDGVVCAQRVNSLRKENCVLQRDADVCDCNPGYENIASVCKVLPEYCVAYSVNGTDCQTCDSAVAYLDGTVCRLGSVTRCAEYNLTSGVCLACENLYYLSDNRCFEHGLMSTTCSATHVTNPKECVSC